MSNANAQALFGYSQSSNRAFTQRITENGNLYPREVSGQDWGGKWPGMAAVFVKDYCGNTKNFILGCGDGNTVFIQSTTDFGAMGAETSRTTVNGGFSVCCSYIIGSTSYVLLHNPSSKKYAIHTVNSDGVLGSEVSSSSWSLGYEILFSVTVGSSTYLVGHSSSENRFFIEGINSDGKLSGKDSTNQKWGSYYPTLIPISVDGSVYIFGQNKKNRWFTQKIDSDGKLASKEADSGNFGNYYATATSFSNVGKTYLMAQTDSEKKKWFTQEIYSDGTLAKNESATEHFSNFYSFLSVFNVQAPKSNDRWMTEIYETTLKTKTLKQIIMPGSHDAGMSSAHECTLLGKPGNTQTQRLAMLGQLMAGSRYFDLRPIARYRNVDATGDVTYQTGHFADSLNFQGCFGERMDEICAAIKEFARTPGRQHELIILKFSHYISDSNGSFTNSWSNAQKAAFANYLTNSLGDLIIRYNGSERVGTLSYGTLMGLGAPTKPKVLIVMDDISEPVRNPAGGIFRYSDYPYDSADPSLMPSYIDLFVYDEYSNTDSVSKLTREQKDQLLNKKNHGGDMFLLSWTLTLQYNLSGALTTMTNDILDLAYKANGPLTPTLEQWVHDGLITAETLPNIIYVDSLSDEQANLAQLMLAQMNKAK